MASKEIEKQTKMTGKRDSANKVKNIAKVFVYIMFGMILLLMIFALSPLKDLVENKGVSQLLVFRIIGGIAGSCFVIAQIIMIIFKFLIGDGKHASGMLNILCRGCFILFISFLVVLYYFDNNYSYRFSKIDNVLRTIGLILFGLMLVLGFAGNIAAKIELKNKHR